MGFAEDSRKTERIARGSAEGLALMYNKRLQVIPALLSRMQYVRFGRRVKLFAQSQLL